MNILITGATGFIGSHLVERLLAEKKHKLILIKRKTSDIWRIKDFINKCLVYDYTELQDLEKIFTENKVDLIIHLATKYVKYENDVNEINEIINTNINFPSTLLYYADKYEVRYFINTGTCFEYQLVNKKINENENKRPFNFYASTKLAFEEILRYYSLNKNIKAITLKLFYPYGEKDNNNKLIPFLIRSIIQNKEINLTKGEQKLDYTYIEDIVDAYLKSIDYIKKIKNYEIFNIGNSKAIAIKEIINYLFKLSRKKIKVSLGKIPYNLNEIMFLEADNKKAKKFLGWKPQNSTYDGLKKTYNFYVKNLNCLTYD
jgi:nucleoside-diphosphate-sugar epimerase